MNIFVSHPSPIISAQRLDNQRVIKMCLESAQLMSTAMHIYRPTTGPWLGGPYRITHTNHPCCIWARVTKENFEWLFEHFKALLHEYSYRYDGKVHKCNWLVPIFEYYLATDALPKGKLTPFVNCSMYKGEANIYEAYKKTLIDKWKNQKAKPRWYHREPPKFYVDPDEFIF